MRAGRFHEYSLQVPLNEKGWRPELGGPGLPEPGGRLWREWQALLKSEALPSHETPSDLGRQRPLARTELLMQPATYGALVENGHNGAPAPGPMLELPLPSLVRPAHSSLHASVPGSARASSLLT